MSLHRFSRYGLALAVLALPATAFAQGFGLNEMNSCGIGRGYAVTGSPCQDASTIFSNPAFAAALSGNSLVLGATSIAVKGTFTRDSLLGRWQTDIPTAYVPNVYFNHKQSDNLAWGFGVYVPYGLTSEWPGNFPGRFVADKAAIQTIYFQPNIAWKINDNWMIGGGPVIGHSTVELIQSADLSQQTASAGPTGPITFGMLGIAQGTEFARGTLKGSAMSYGFALGVYGKIAKHWTMGARYLSSLNFNYSNGKATFQQVPTGLTLSNGNPLGAPAGTPVDALVASQFTSGALVAQSGATEIAHPDQAEVGVGYDGFDRWLLSADYYWVGWKRFHSLDVQFANPALNTTQVEDYNNSSAIRMGAQYTGANSWQWRVGFAGVAAAAPDQTVTPILPDQDRMNYTAGLGIPLGKAWTIDAAYAYVWTPGRRGRIVGRSSASQPSFNDGVYTLSANIISVSLKASF
ncbi:MAG TPA: outer membrane protein transport protein [Gemmatimonadaceae bacterium]|nr:outer membrane protein transport protein [Gemmatimonadaceae bacterium]